MHPQIAAFARLARENSLPTRKLEGTLTRLGRTMHDIAYDAIHDEIVVGSPFAQAIMTFRGGASGEEQPIRIIQGPHTQIVTASNGVDKVGGIDPVNNEIYYSTRLNKVLVFDREANGDVAPKRVLGGPDTPRIGSTIRIDPVNNLLFVAGGGGVMIFDRLASGNAKPRATIRGQFGNQWAVYNDLIISPREDDHIYAWSIHETGENPKPVLRIPAPLGPRAHQLGLVLDPAHQEVIVGSGAGNQIRVFSVPEIFDLARTQRSER
jgi:hypothetical protein